MSRLGFEPRTRGSKVRLPAVHGVAWRSLASTARANGVHPLHGLGWLFLDDRSDIDGVTPEDGRPTSAKIFAPFAQGLVFESGASYLGGLEDLDEMPNAWTAAKTFDEFVRSLD